MFLTYDSEKLDEFSGKLQRLDSQRFFKKIIFIATAASDHDDQQKKESSKCKILSTMNIVHLEL